MMHVREQMRLILKWLKWRKLLQLSLLVANLRFRTFWSSAVGCCDAAPSTEASSSIPSSPGRALRASLVVPCVSSTASRDIRCPASAESFFLSSSRLCNDPLYFLPLRPRPLYWYCFRTRSSLVCWHLSRLAWSSSQLLLRAFPFCHPTSYPTLEIL